MYSILKPIKIYTQSGAVEWEAEVVKERERESTRSRENEARPPKRNKMNGLFDVRTVTTTVERTVNTRKKNNKITQHTIENFIFYSFLFFSSHLICSMCVHLYLFPLCFMCMPLCSWALQYFMVYIGITPKKKEEKNTTRAAYKMFFIHFSASWVLCENEKNAEICMCGCRATAAVE